MDSLEFFDDNGTISIFNLINTIEVYSSKFKEEVNFDKDMVLFNNLTDSQVYILKPNKKCTDFVIVEANDIARNHNFYGLNIIGTSINKGIYQNDENDTIVKLAKKVYKTGKTEFVNAKLHQNNIITITYHAKLFKYEDYVIMTVKNTSLKSFMDKYEKLIRNHEFNSSFILQNLKIVMANDSFLDKLKLELNDTFNEDIKEKIQVLEGSNYEQWNDIYKRIINQDITHYAEKIRVKIANQIRWFFINATFTLFNDKTAVLFKYDDITDEQDMIQELNERQEETKILKYQLRELQFLSNTAISYKMNNEHIMWTPASYKILDLNINEEYHGDLSEFIIKEESDSDIEQLINGSDSTFPHISYKQCIKTPKGNIKYLIVDTTFKFDKRGKRVGFTSYYIDVSQM